MAGNEGKEDVERRKEKNLPFLLHPLVYCPANPLSLSSFSSSSFRVFSKAARDVGKRRP